MDILESAVFVDDDSVGYGMPERVRRHVLVGPRTSAHDLGLDLGDLGESLNGAIHTLASHAVATPGGKERTRFLAGVLPAVAKVATKPIPSLVFEFERSIRA